MRNKWMAHVTPRTDIINQPLGGLGREEWLARIDEIGESEGYFEPVGPNHSAILIDRSQSVLLVTFEELDQVRLANANGQPIGFKLAVERGWSHLCILAHGDTWYRDARLYGYFDRLVEDGFFEDYDRVVFYGSEMGAYGAAAFSVAAPGSTVLAIQPVATLAPDRSAWDPRFRQFRRLDFHERYGYAPFMIDAAMRAFVVYDPQEHLDAMHASLFDHPAVELLPCPHLGGRIEVEFEQMGILQQLLELAGNGELDRAAFYRLYRRRRESAAYLRRLLDALEAADRPFFAAQLCRFAVERLNRRRFHEGLRAAETKLSERRARGDATMVQAG